MSSVGVVRVHLAISGLFTLSASLIWAVNTLFLLDAGLGLFEVFMANAAFTGGMIVFEIPTGILADADGTPALVLSERRYAWRAMAARGLGDDLAI